MAAASRAAERLLKLAEDWVAAWNAHDLERILAHYADDAELTSPVVARVVGEPSGTLRGKDALRAYFGRALAARPDLAFEVLDVLTGVGSVTLYYRSGDRRAAETMVLDAEGRVRRSLVQYAR